MENIIQSIFSMQWNWIGPLSVPFFGTFRFFFLLNMCPFISWDILGLMVHYNRYFCNAYDVSSASLIEDSYDLPRKMIIHEESEKMKKILRHA